MSARRMYRYVVPVDDMAHRHPLTGDPVAVAPSGDREVKFWAEDDPDRPSSWRHFQVFGTGQPLPAGARWAGTCPRTVLGLVWHLYEVTP